MNISLNIDPIELCEGLLDRYQQALQFRGIKHFHPCESHLWEPPVRAKKLTKIVNKSAEKCQKPEYLFK